MPKWSCACECPKDAVTKEECKKEESCWWSQTEKQKKTENSDGLLGTCVQSEHVALPDPSDPRLSTRVSTLGRVWVLTPPDVDFFLGGLFERTYLSLIVRGFGGSDPGNNVDVFVFFFFFFLFGRNGGV